MKIDKAKEIAKLVADIKEEENQLERFERTREFCNITIIGENGAESQYSFKIGHKNHNDETKLIRGFIEDVIKSRIETLNNRLKEI